MLAKRQARYDQLKAMGLQHFEALTLSKLPKDIPYLRKLVIERRDEFAAFKNKPENKGKHSSIVKSLFNHRIDARYKRQGWIAYGSLMSKETVFKMLRSFEKPYKREHPEYERNKTRYPKGHHARNRQTTSKKLGQGQLQILKAELKQWGNMDNDRTRSLREQIERLENK
jgi:hypothetical protein